MNDQKNKLNKRCWLLHDWGVWEEAEKGTMVDEYNFPTGRYIIQKRSCQRCGKIKINRQRT